MSIDEASPEPSCPACGERGLDLFYDDGIIPAHSCLLMDSPDAAAGYPRAHLQLGFCPTCGFITNVHYRPEMAAYSQAYEETQHFSPRFSRFAVELAQRWIDRYDLRGKTILEIGCGKGEFLALLCELGDCHGIGIDPSVIPERIESPAKERMRFIRDYYGPRHAEPAADVILCRHTLEHIHAVGEFTESLRDTIGDATDTLVLFELPDVTRVLTEAAFWDIYYEHCTYFTAGSLARLFRRNRFDLLELERDYGDQYLLLAARPAGQASEGSLPLEDDLSLTTEQVETFREQVVEVKATWKQRFVDARKSGKRVVAWGAGSKCVAFVTSLGLGEELEYVIDINPHKQGKYLPGSGHPVRGPDEVATRPPDLVVVMNPIYLEEIRKELAGLGCDPELLAV